MKASKKIIAVKMQSRKENKLCALGPLWQNHYFHASTIDYKAVICLFLFFIFCFDTHAQQERKLVRDGNKLYKEKKFSDAEVSYKKSLDVKKDSRYGQFNLGDAYYKEGKFDDAVKQFTPLASDKKFDKVEQSQAYHNLGNAYLQSKKYEESIGAYKNSLKLNPKDNDTRYNLAYAQAMLKKDQQQQKNKDQKKEGEKKDQKQDQKDQKQDQKDQKNDQKDQQKKDEQKGAQKQPQKISKEDAEKILQALNNDEKNIQKKMQKRDARKVVIEKNW